MIKRHRLVEPAYDLLDPARSLLQFDVSVLNASRPGCPASDTPRLTMGIRMSNPQAGAAPSTPIAASARLGVLLKLSLAFPTYAPQ
ncbi:hypothetical protein ACS0X5_10870 [Burkholderia gladioli]|uniref:hypothetical protein n=1 Tax=Burkholderia gladioli TaxID=28095 RepID=UPI003F7A0D50